MVGPIITFLVDPKKNSVESCQELLADLSKHFASCAEAEAQTAARATTVQVRNNAVACEQTWNAAKFFVDNVKVEG